MGVHGLCELLSPVGRRVSIETFAGKRLNIDARIWMVQFMKTMREERGKMVGNAHLLSFFRRICKLLYLRTKLVFDFDGGTPALKRGTLITPSSPTNSLIYMSSSLSYTIIVVHLQPL